MRTNVVRLDVTLLRYAIREIVDVMQKLSEIDSEYRFVRENIGDPIAKNWPVADFVKEILIEEIKRKDNTIFGYTHSRGNPAVRKWIVEYAKRFSPNCVLDYESVLLTNGLGSAIAILYHMFPKGARILQPAPCYPTHASFESFAAGEEPLLYHLDPSKGWQPDLDEIESQVKKNPGIAGILIINPNNPTGAVYSGEVLENIVRIAEENKLMLISDEIYFRMIYNGRTHTHLSEIAAGRIPLIVLKGLSKDVPWPGSRCGWIEFHNTNIDDGYRGYCEGVKKRVLLEVCSTTMPQTVIPKIYDHPQYEEWLQHNNKALEQNGNQIGQILSNVPSLKVVPPDGAFYMMPLFEKDVLNNNQTLPIRSDRARTFIESELARPGMHPDKRFTYYLLASTGICVVPASGFYCPIPGFRLTTLERNAELRNATYRRLSAAISEYLNS
ncbi:pyridoxal phosphate-dependent aminotransferase [bacterium]|nr:pyridoxal phosphate-dependent aminotransferase [bacterium]MCI0612554.1 pyridoxal phosphate-dependent aminotransferase [bacterium]